jgi:hypothetical protein
LPLVRRTHRPQRNRHGRVRHRRSGSL